jgi:predicted amidohydrolase
MHELKVACVQMNISHCQKESNLEKALSMARYALSEGADLIILPEVFSTGFCYDNIESLAEVQNGMVLSRLSDLSREYNCVIVSSIIEKELSGSEIKYYNLGFCIEDGEIAGTYRKTHPFKNESEFFTAGNSITPIKLRNRKLSIGLEICYEIRFPEVSRKLALDGADILITVAEFPKPRRHIWRTLACARAIENQIPHIACNCVGESPVSSFFGGSMIIDSLGEVCVEADDKESVLIYTLNLDEVKSVRSNIPVFDDRNPTIY